MRRFWLAAVAGLVLAASPAWAADTTDGEHGTSLHFAKSPSEAAQLAKKQEKLVFVLHLSGIFEDPGCT